MKTNLLVLSFVFLVSHYAAMAIHFSADSTQAQKTDKPYSLRFTSRVQSLGFFYYNGRIASHNPSFDINFNYERNGWGYTFFKAIDVYDFHSEFNFALTAVYKNIHINKKLTVTPNVVFLIEQMHTVADKGSDTGFVLNTTYRFNKTWAVEESSVFFNVMLEQSMLDWINRLRLLYTKNHTDVTFIVWNNNKLFDEDAHLSTALNIAYGRIKVSEHLSLSTGITGTLMLRTRHTEFEKANGIMFSIAAVVH